MHFLYPNVIFFMLIPTIILAFLILTKKNTIEKYFSKEAINRLNIQSKHLSTRQRTALLYVCILLMTLSLARPVMDKKEQEFKQETISFVVAIDVSKSMLAQDLKPNRLSFAKQKLLQIIELSKHNAIGVVLFSSSSYILSPLTQDFISLKTLVENLDFNRKFDRGSSLINALKTSNKLLRDSMSKNIIILSDGTDKSSFEKEIEFAQENSLKVYSIAMATNKQTPIKAKESFLTNDKGKIVTTAFNENIKNLSLQTKAAFINYSFDKTDIKAILNEIQTSSKKQNLKNKKFKTYVELFYYPLILALILMLIAFSSLPKLKKVAPLLLLCFINSESQAFSFNFQTIDEANKAYENKQFKKASDEFKKVDKTVQGKYNLANSLYKQGKYKDALNQYNKVITSDNNLQFKKLHNLGNTYTKLNDLQSAVSMYEKALKLKEDEQTRKNLETIKKAMKKQQQSGGKNSKDQKNSKDKKENQKQKNQKSKKEEKNKKQQKEKQEESEKQKQEKEQQKKQNEKSKNSKNKEDIAQKGSKNKQLNKGEISDLEEKKWLKNLNKQKMQILLKKDEIEEKNNFNSNKW